MAQAEWLYLIGPETRGPVTAEALQELFSSRQISQETLILKDGTDIWKLYGDVFLKSPSSLAPPAAVSQTAPAQPAIPATITPSSGATPEVTPAAGWTDTTPHPWRRYFARMLDTFLGGGLMFFLVGFILAALAGPEKVDQLATALSGNQGRVVDAILTFLLAIPVNALLIGLTGGSVGKWLFGIRVLNAQGRPLGVVTALKREGMVWIFGLGVCIPIVSLVTLIVAYQKLTKEGQTSWDRSLNASLWQRPNSTLQIVLGFVGVALWLLIFFGLRVM